VLSLITEARHPSATASWLVPRSVTSGTGSLLETQWTTAGVFPCDGRRVLRVVPPAHDVKVGVGVWIPLVQQQTAAVFVSSPVSLCVHAGSLAVGLYNKPPLSSSGDLHWS